MPGPKSHNISGVIDLTLSDSDDEGSLGEAHDSDIQEISSFPTLYNAKPIESETVVKQELTNDGSSDMVEAGASYKRGRDATRSRSPSRSKRIKDGLETGEKEDGLDPETHEDVMRRDAAERPRSSSGKLASVSPGETNVPNAIAGPGPQTLALRRPSSEVDPSNVIPPTHFHTLTSSRPTSPIPKATRVSPFQEAFGVPGSFGHAVPIGTNRPRATSKPVSLPAPGDWGNSIPMKIGTGKGKARETSLPSVGLRQTKPHTPTTALPVQQAQTFLSNPISDMPLPSPSPSSRKRPTWATAAAADAIDQTSDVAVEDPGATAVPDLIDPVVAITREAARDVPTDEGLSTQAPDVVDSGQSSDPIPTAIKAIEHVTARAIIDTLEHGPSAPPQQSTSGFPQLDAISQDPTNVIEPIAHIEQTTHIADGYAAEGALEMIIHRAASHETDDSIQEISADIAMSQAIFNRAPRKSTSGGHLGTSITIDGVVENAGTERVLGDIHTAQTITSLPTLRDRAIRREGSVSTSASVGSPSKRQSGRLAARTEIPVYTFKTNTYEPIRWRQTIELDGESIDVLVPKNGISSSDTSTAPSTIMVNGIERTVLKTYYIPIIDTPPPPERVSRAVRDFDTRLIDQWNAISPTLTHNPALHRMIFQMHIDDSLGGQEPTIGVFNDVDVESIPPNFEFQYSNTMLYIENVPEPELGQGCGCEGPCSEEAGSSCSCLKRQQLYNYDIIDGFAYEKNGRLKENSVPIWECGPNCGCPPECMNRVIQKGRTKEALIDLFKTEDKGWGVKARQNIAGGTFLGIYSGELISEEESERRGHIYAAVGRTYLFDCDGWQIRHPPKGLEELDPRLAELAYATEARAKQEIEETGNDKYNAYCVDAFHYGFTRYFNHSCDPNLAIAQAYVTDYHPERPLLVIFTRRPVRANEELCISYKGIPDAEDEVVVTKRGKRYKTKRSKRTSTAHVSNPKKAKSNKCYCDAPNCDGIMFNIASPSITPE